MSRMCRSYQLGPALLMLSAKEVKTFSELGPMGLKQDLRDVKNDKEFVTKREEILSMIWDMEEEIMGKEI